jgi:hypothetical protein
VRTEQFRAAKNLTISFVLVYKNQPWLYSLQLRLLRSCRAVYNNRALSTCVSKSAHIAQRCSDVFCLGHFSYELDV